MHVVMIVKDEAPRIRACLRSAMTAGVTTGTIVDTGSTDGTQEIVRSLGFEVHERPWISFGNNRSEAFALAKGDWLLALDADMTVEIDSDFVPDPSVDAYMLDMGPEFSNRLPLLLRGDLPWVSRGAVHEYTCLANGSLGRRVPTDKVRITQPGATWTQERGLRDAALLEADLPDPRATFYLAQTYRDLGDPRALRVYRDRVELGDCGHPEERFYAAYQAALLEPDWRIRHLALLGAWEMRPSRLEPLYEVIAELNRRDAHQSAYLLASVSIIPTSDDLFVHRAVWDWGMAFERSIAAWWLGYRDEFQTLCDELLSKSLPDTVRARIIANLAEAA